MKTSFETDNSTNKLRRSLAVGALSLAAAFGPGLATAEAHAAKPQSISKLENFTEKRMRQHKGNAFFHGTLSILERVRDPIEPKLSHTVELNIQNPFIVYRARPQTQSGFKFIESSEYAYGYIDQDAKKPEVTYLKFNPKNMSLTAEPTANPSTIEYAALPANGSGGLDYEHPGVSNDNHPDLHGGPLTDPSGNQERLALAYVPQK